MRAFESLMIALVVVTVILRTTDARQLVLDLYGSVSFYTKLLDPKNYPSLQEDCENNGGNESYNNLRRSVLRFNHDITRFVTNLDNDVKLGLPDLRVGSSLFHDDCYQRPNIQKSIEQVSESLQACVEPEKRERIAIDSRLVNSFLEYICGSAGQDLARFVHAGGRECLASKQQGLLNCAKQSFDHYLQGTEFVGNGFSELKGAETLFHLKSKRCADIAQFRNCSIGVLEKCEDQITARVFKVIIWDFLLSATSCIGSFDEKPTVTEEIATINGTSVGVPTKEVFVDFMTDKCAKNGGSTAYASLEESWKLFVNGFLLLVDVPRLKAVLPTVHLKDKFNPISKMYCRRGLIMNDFHKYLTDALKPCLSLEERKAADIAHSVASSLIRVSCYNEGNGIAGFVAASGVECLVSKQDAIEDCANQTLGIHAGGIDWERPLERLQRPLVIDAKDCSDVVELRHCSVRALAECEDKTPAYLVDSMFSTVLNEMSCQNLIGPQTTTAADINYPLGSLSSRAWDQAEKDYAINEAEEVFRDMCEKNGGLGTYETIKEVPRYLVTGNNLLMLNMQELRQHVDTMRQLGQPDAFIMKFCRKIPAFQKFQRHIMDSMVTCLKPNYRDTARLQFNISNAFLEFACLDEGDYVLSFIHSGGVECWLSQQQALENCVPNSIRHPDDIEEIVGLARHEVCTLMTETLPCIASALEKCENSTPSRIMNHLFQYLTKVTSCGTFESSPVTINGTGTDD